MDRDQWLDQFLEVHCLAKTAKQVAILRSAIILFAEKGYASTSTKEIAETAGVAEGTLFKHYATKKDLMLTITEMIVGDLFLSLIRPGIDGIFSKEYADLEDLLATFMKNRLSLLDQGISVYRILLQEIPFHPEIQRMMIDRMQRLSYPELLKPFRDKGLLIDLPDADVLLYLTTCISGYLNTRYVLLPELFSGNPAFDREKDMNNFIGFLVRSLTKKPEAHKEEVI